MAIIRITAQEARNYVKKNEVKLQEMYDAAPFTNEDPNPDMKPVARGFTSFREFIGKKEENVKANILQT